MKCCRKGDTCWCKCLLGFAILVAIAVLFFMAGCGNLDFQPTITDPETGKKLTADQYAQISIERERKIEADQAKAETAFKIALAKVQSKAQTDVAEVVAEHDGAQADLQSAIESLRDMREVTMAEFERQRQQRAALWQSMRSIPVVGQVANQFQLDPLVSGALGISGTGAVATLLLGRAKRRSEEEVEARVRSQYEDKIKTHNAAWDSSREELRREMLTLLPSIMSPNRQTPNAAFGAEAPA